MRCLYQKDERTLPGNLQSRKYRFFLSYSKCSVSHYFPPLSLSLSVRKINCTQMEIKYLNGMFSG
jgi:hypothetical protein